MIDQVVKIGDLVHIESKGAPLPDFYGVVKEAWIEYPLMIHVAKIAVSADEERIFDSSVHKISVINLPLER